MNGYDVFQSQLFSKYNPLKTSLLPKKACFKVSNNNDLPKRRGLERKKYLPPPLTKLAT